MAVIFKQPAICMAPVPLMWLVLCGSGRRTVANILAASAPLIFVGLFLVGIQTLRPDIFHLTIIVPKGYPLSVAEAIKAGWAFIAGAVPFWLALGIWLIQRPLVDQEWKLRLEWTVVATFLSVAASALAVAKAGGTGNSFIPAWFALGTLCWLLLLPWLNQETPLSSRRGVGPVVTSLAFVLMVMPTPVPSTYFFRHWHTQDPAYKEIIALTAQLPGRVICPEEPLIALRAKQTIGRNIFLEYDARWWPDLLPPELATDFQNSDYIIDCEDWWQNILRPQHLSDLGFIKESSATGYGIWKRKQ
jgi:hypothetical protein